MTTLTVEVDKERDLQEVQTMFTRMGLKFLLMRMLKMMTGAIFLKQQSKE